MSFREYLIYLEKIAGIINRDFEEMIVQMTNCYIPTQRYY